MLLILKFYNGTYSYLTVTHFFPFHFLIEEYNAELSGSKGDNTFD
jgi:hypothetical protein